MEERATLKIDELVPYFTKLFKPLLKELGYEKAIDLGKMMCRCLLFSKSQLEGGSTSSFFYENKVGGEVAKSIEGYWIGIHDRTNSRSLVNIIILRNADESLKSQLADLKEFIKTIGFLLRKIEKLDLERRESVLLWGSDIERAKAFRAYAEFVINSENAEILKKHEIHLEWGFDLLPDETEIRVVVNRCRYTLEVKKGLCTVERLDGDSHYRKISNIDKFAQTINEVIQNL